MKFIKIKASWEDYPDRLNRIFVIREDLSLYDLGVTLCKLFKTKFEHMFLFEGDNCVYEDETRVLDSLKRAYDYKKKKALDVLLDNKKLKFIYDTGEYYCFIVKKISKQIYEYPILCDALLLEANGDGIFEDNISGLVDLMEGEIDENSLVSFGEELPEDYNFDVAFDIDYINYMLILNIPFFESWQDDGRNDIVFEEYSED